MALLDKFFIQHNLNYIYEKDTVLFYVYFFFFSKSDILPSTGNRLKHLMRRSLLLIQAAAAGGGSSDYIEVEKLSIGKIESITVLAGKLWWPGGETVHSFPPQNLYWGKSRRGQTKVNKGDRNHPNTAKEERRGEEGCEDEDVIGLKNTEKKIDLHSINCVKSKKQKTKQKHNQTHRHRHTHTKHAMMRSCTKIKQHLLVCDWSYFSLQNGKKVWKK